MDDKQIEKLAIAVTNALNKSETVGKRKIVDNSKKIKSLQKEIEKKKKLLQKIEKGEIKGLHMSKVMAACEFRAVSEDIGAILKNWKI